MGAPILARLDGFNPRKRVCKLFRVRSLIIPSMEMEFGIPGHRCLSKELSGAGLVRVSDLVLVRIALGVEGDVADRRPVSDLA